VMFSAVTWMFSCFFLQEIMNKRTHITVKKDFIVADFSSFSRFECIEICYKSAPLFTANCYTISRESCKIHTFLKREKRIHTPQYKCAFLTPKRLTIGLIIKRL
jgi:hypothetical protein